MPETEGEKGGGRSQRRLRREKLVGQVATLSEVSNTETVYLGEGYGDKGQFKVRPASDQGRRVGETARNWCVKLC